jgi:uncharacterized membrane protein
MLEEEEQEEDKISISAPIWIGALTILSAIVIFNAAKIWCNDSNYDRSIFSYFGGFYGGVFGTIFACTGLFFIYNTYKVQRD